MAFLIRKEPGLRVTAQTGTLPQARHPLRQETDLVVVSLMPPDGDGAEHIRELRRCDPGAAVLVLTADVVPGGMGRVLELGADEVLQESAGVDEIIGAIKRLAADRTTRP